MDTRLPTDLSIFKDSAIGDVALESELSIVRLE